MRPGTKAALRTPAETQLQGFINKFEAKHSALIRVLRKVLRKCMPTANELVWDNYNFFVLSYNSTERPSDCIVTIAAAANGLGLPSTEVRVSPIRMATRLRSGLSELAVRARSRRQAPPIEAGVPGAPRKLTWFATCMMLARC
jgi:hypothetical protein